LATILTGALGLYKVRDQVSSSAW